MSRIIKTWRDPYDCGFTPTRPRQIEINPGLTVLVGCNGAGKSTLLSNIKSELKNKNIPCHLYDNLYDGGRNGISVAFFEGDYEFGSKLAFSSEGERISMNLGRQFIVKVRKFFETGYFDTTEERWEKLFKDKNDEEENMSNERWLLLDAMDSGLSVDNVVDLIDIFNLILEDSKNFNVDVYIIISANEYELCRGNQCFDVNNGKYITFSDYEEYRNFILKSREKKEKRYKKET